MDAPYHVIIALFGFSTESFQCPAQAVNKSAQQTVKGLEGKNTEEVILIQAP